MVDTLDRSTGAQRPEPERSSRRRRFRPDLGRLLPPRKSFPVIGSMRPFLGCNRRQIWHIARWGEVIEARPGDVLVREDHTDYWFFVVLSGAVQASRAGKVVATLGAGDHFGETAIVGFRPQPSTVVAVEPTLLFVLGRRHLLTLASSEKSVQRALFPETESVAYTAFVRRLQAEGRDDWERLRPRYRTGHRLGTSRLPGRDLSWSDALEVLSHQVPRPPTVLRIEAQPISKRRLLVLIGALLAALTVAATLYHPPAAVVNPGRPIDVVGDISITGTRVYRPTGKYLLTPVDVDRPNLAGLFVARVLGKTVVNESTARMDATEAKRRAHEAFLNSHHQAIAVAERILRVRTRGVTIAIRDRQIGGPSAGLVYALAVIDMLGTSDLAAGRTIAATGELQRDGGIGAVGFVSLKAQSARRARADVFLVPESQVLAARTSDLIVLGASRLGDAVRALEKRR